MKAEELRIGNVFDYHGVMVNVMDIMTSGIKKPRVSFGYFIDSVGFERFLDQDDCPKPIQLSSDWLKRFGFILHEDETWEKDIIILVGDDNYFLDVNILFNQKGIVYVHDLQNLYFTLTGKELDFKNT
jgi:hypothetical protein